MLKYEGGEIRCRRILLAETGGLFEFSKDAECSSPRIGEFTGGPR